MHLLKNTYNSLKFFQKHNEDFFEAMAILTFCVFLCCLLPFIHPSYFSPFVEKQFLVECSISITCMVGILALYEWSLIKKQSK